MIQKIKLALFALALSLTSATPALVPAIAHADNIKSPLCSGSQAASGDTTQAGCTDGNLGNGESLKTLAGKIVNLVSIVVGAISIIMIIYGGFRYITSGGDSGRVGSAKNTLIYAVIGLIVVALAQLIVNFVLNTANNVTTTG